MHATLKTVKVKQAELNDSTRGQWAMFASHRAQIERLLLAARPRERGSVCVLGAGNCNDLDLNWLSKTFDRIELADIDESSLQGAVTRQKVNTSSIRFIAPVDLTGIASAVDAWKAPEQISPQDVDVAIGLAQNAKVPELEGRQFDAVLSPCVLSQLLSPARDALGKSPRLSRPLLSALRERHLRLMLDLLAPGGAGLLACDLVSSDTVPPVARAKEEELPGLMRTLLTNGKCFKGLEPAHVVADLVSLGATRTRVIAPWLWRLGFHRTYMVYAVQFSARA